MVESDLAMADGRGIASCGRLRGRGERRPGQGRSREPRAPGRRKGALSVRLLPAAGGVAGGVAGARGNEARDKILLFRLRRSERALFRTFLSKVMTNFHFLSSHSPPHSCLLL